MTWITCEKCGYTDSIAFVDAYFNMETKEYETSNPSDRWKCPKCSRTPLSS